jgi:hypothetical protein
MWHTLPKNRINFNKIALMPLVKIELAKGFNADSLNVLIEQTMNAVANVLELPDDDRNIRLME